MAFTILRDNFYADALADIAALVLRDPDRHVDATYTLTGPQALTLPEIATRGRRPRARPEVREPERRGGVRLPGGRLRRRAVAAGRRAVSTYTAIADGSCADVTDDIATLRLYRARTLEDALAP
jgi:NAD(P)H dehydrogenase (quinone)